MRHGDVTHICNICDVWPTLIITTHQQIGSVQIVGDTRLIEQIDTGGCLSVVDAALTRMLIILQVDHLLVGHLTQILHHLHVLALNRVKLLLVIIIVATVRQTANNLLIIVLQNLFLLVQELLLLLSALLGIKLRRFVLGTRIILVKDSVGRRINLHLLLVLLLMFGLLLLTVSERVLRATTWLRDLWLLRVSLGHLLFKDLLDLGSVVGVHVVLHQSTGRVRQTVLVLLLHDSAASTSMMLILRLLGPSLILICANRPILILLQRALLTLLILIALRRDNAAHVEVVVLLHVVAHSQVLLVVAYILLLTI